MNTHFRFRKYKPYCAIAGWVLGLWLLISFLSSAEAREGMQRGAVHGIADSSLHVGQLDFGE